MTGREKGNGRKKTERQLDFRDRETETERERDEEVAANREGPRYNLAQMPNRHYAGLEGLGTKGESTPTSTQCLCLAVGVCVGSAQKENVATHNRRDANDDFFVYGKARTKTQTATCTYHRHDRKRRTSHCSRSVGTRRIRKGKAIAPPVRCWKFPDPDSILHKTATQGNKRAKSSVGVENKPFARSVVLSHLYKRTNGYYSVLLLCCTDNRATTINTDTARPAPWRAPLARSPQRM